MKRRTISKRISKNKRSLNKRPLKRTGKKTKRRSKRRTSKKVEQKGGGDITLILDILLSKDIISFMPTSQVFEYEKMSRYMNMIDIHTLKDIVLENSYWRKSPTIQKIFNYTSEELKDLQIELIDRFGLLPTAAKNHIRLAELKNRAVQLGIDKIDASNKGGYLNFGEETRTDPAALISLVQNQGDIYRLRGAHRLQFGFGLDLSDVENRFLFMEELLDKLALPEVQSVEEAS